MATFVLVPGAWLGAWVWKSVRSDLEQRGHHVEAVTLSGLAERANAAAGHVTLENQVSDVVHALENIEGGDVILVGHSFAGIVTGQATDRVPERVAHEVFVDANLPHHGRSLFDDWSPAGRQFVQGQIDANHGLWPAPEAADLLDQGLSADEASLMVERATGHPGRTLGGLASLTGAGSAVPKTYIACMRGRKALPEDVEALRGHAGWTFEELDSGHWPMVSARESLCELLHSVAT